MGAETKANASTFRITVRVQRAQHDAFFEWASHEFDELGEYLGAHEGTLLADDAHRLGFETEAWVLDSGLAPENRDWASELQELSVEFYFSSLRAAAMAYEKIRQKDSSLEVNRPEEVPSQDWDAEWKASFQGVEVEPDWLILPDWKKADSASISSFPSPSFRRVIFLTPGAGFGTGTHETTQLCLQAISKAAAKRGSLNGVKALDFGSGSGILSVASASLGAHVDGVEIDPLAIDNAHHNLSLNTVLGQVRFHTGLNEVSGQADLILANILKPVLLAFREQLLEKLKENCLGFILSGLMDPDAEEVRKAYAGHPKLLAKRFEVLAQGEWRALVWL